MEHGSSLFGGEIFEIRGWLIGPSRHDFSVGIEVVMFAADFDLMLIFATSGLLPDRISLAMILAFRGPGARQGVIIGRQVVPQYAGIRRVQKNAFLDDRLVVFVKGHSTAIITARS